MRNTAGIAAALALLLQTAPSGAFAQGDEPKAQAPAPNPFPDCIVLTNGMIVECKVLSTTDAAVVAHVRVAGIEADVTYPRSSIQEVSLNVSPTIPGDRKGPAAPAPREQSKDPEPAQKPKAAPAEPTDRQKVLGAVSGDYAGGPSTAMTVRIKRLQALMNSQDPQVLAVAKLALGIDSLYTLINKQADFSAEGRMLTAQAIAFALTSDDDDSLFDMLRQATDAINMKGGAVDMALNRIREIMDSGDNIQRTQNALRRAVKRMVLEPGEPALNAGDLSITFSPVGKAGEQFRTSSEGYLTLSNRSGRTLPAVTCIVDVHTSNAKVDAAIAEEKRRWAVPSLVTVGVGVDPALQKRNLENALRYYERLRLGYGMMVYVPALRPGANVKFDFATLGDIDHVVDAVDVLVVSEGVGKHTASLDVDSMRKEIERVVRAQMERTQRRR